MAEVAPMAEWRPLPRAMSTTPLRHDIICLHTMVGSLAGSWSWSSRAGGSYWHFGVGGGGAIWQCQDLRYKSAANLNGNWRVIPIETEDMGAHFAPWGSSCGNVPWWTDAQMDALVRLVAWLCARYDIPPVLIPDTLPGRRGIAFHRLGIDPWRVSGGELWSNSAGKCCPDWRRIQQLVEGLIPRVLAALTGSDTAEPTDTTPVQEDDDMTYMLKNAEANKVFLVGAGGVTELGPSAVKDYTDAGFKMVTVRSANHANKVLEDADRPRRLELYLVALGQIEGREEQRDLAGG